VKTSPIHLLIPMSGQGTRYRAAGYEQPKPLIPVSGEPMIARLMAVFPEAWPAHFVMAENHRETDLPAALRDLRPTAKQSFVPVHGLGPSHAILEGLKQIPNDAPVLVSYCDYGMVWDPVAFERFVRSTNCDSCVISYRGFHPHYLSPTLYAYSRMDGERVVEVREKGHFTPDRQQEFASSGGYYFKSATLLREAIEFQMARGMALKGEYYTSLTVQALLEMKQDAQVRVFEIPKFFQWGTPDDLKAFEFWEKTFQNRNRFAEAGRMEVDHVLMPMAGLGSRFSSITSLPKPLIRVNGKPMFISAVETLPRAKSSVFVCLDGFAESAQAYVPQGGKFVSLRTTPSGQALSTEAGLDALEETGDVVVSSCDHGVVMDPARWAEFRANPGCDAAIFTVRGFSGAARRPNAYAYVVSSGTSKFPDVTTVSVKKPVSDHPSNDAVLVGTFWFRSREVLRNAIEELKKADVRVNGELYLDSVFEGMIRRRAAVREIPLDGYLCWGDPDSLAEAVYWQETFCGRGLAPRPRFPEMEK
jgi:NDP-sugar pyrophosphorylase family protein